MYTVLTIYTMSRYIPAQLIQTILVVIDFILKSNRLYKTNG